MPNVNGKKNTSSASPRGKNVIPVTLTSKAGLAAAKRRANRVTSVQAENGPNISMSIHKRGKSSTYVTPSSYSTKTKKGKTTTTTTTDKKTGSVSSYKETSMPKRKYPTTTVMRTRRGPGRG